MGDNAAGPILSEALLEEIFQTQIVEYLVDELKPPAERPEVVLVVAQLGASTGPVHHELWGEFLDLGGIVPVRTEELRAFHPDYDALVLSQQQGVTLIGRQRSAAWIEHTDQAARWWTGRAVEHLADQRYNIALEDSYLSPAVVAALVETFSELDYDVRVAAMATPPAVSRLSIVERFTRIAVATGAGLWVDSEEHDASYTNVIDVVGQAQSMEAVRQIDLHTFDGLTWDRGRDPNGGWRDVGSGMEAGDASPLALLGAVRSVALGQAQRVVLAEQLTTNLNQLAAAGVAHRGIWSMAGDVVRDLAAHSGQELPLDPRTMHNLNSAMLRVLDADAIPGIDAELGGTDAPGHRAPDADTGADLPELPPDPGPDLGPDLGP